MNADIKFDIRMDFGSVEITSWFEWVNGAAIGMGRRVVRDQGGTITAISEGPTGARLVVV